MGLAARLPGSDNLILALNESSRLLWGRTGPGEVGASKASRAKQTLSFSVNESHAPPRYKLRPVALWRLCAPALQASLGGEGAGQKWTD